MNQQFEQLVNYIRLNLNQSISEAQIRQILLEYNWNAEIIDRAFLYAKTQQTEYPSAQPHSPEVYAANQAAQPRPEAVPDSNPYEHVNLTHEGLATPKKYKVLRAIADTFQAMKKNTGGFILSALMSYVVAIISLMLIFLLIRTVSGGVGLLAASRTKLIVELFIALVFLTAWYVLSVTFILSTTSLALYDGSENRKSSLSAILSQSISRLGRVILANLLVFLVAVWPIVFMSIFPIILIVSGVVSNGSALILLPILMIVAIIWLYLALLRFALAPYIALFEPTVPITKTLRRSRHLLAKGGQWFLIKGFLLTLLILIFFAVITGQNLPELADSNSIAITILLTVVSIMINGSLVMLYKNRKIVRSQV